MPNNFFGPIFMIGDFPRFYKRDHYGISWKKVNLFWQIRYSFQNITKYEKPAASTMEHRWFSNQSHTFQQIQPDGKGERTAHSGQHHRAGGKGSLVSHTAGHAEAIDCSW